MVRAFTFSAFAAIFLIASCGNDSKSKDVDEGNSDAMFMAEMSRIYGFKCAICHGKDGVSVIKLAPNLTESKMTLEERIAIIKYGKSTMPPQKDVLDMPTIRGLAMYIDSLK